MQLASMGPRIARRVPEGLVLEPPTRFTVAPLSPTIGAEVHGVDLADVDDELHAELRRALLEWKVLFFRDQDISQVQHRAFAERWGELEQHPFYKFVHPGRRTGTWSPRQGCVGGRRRERVARRHHVARPPVVRRRTSSRRTAGARRRHPVGRRRRRLRRAARGGQGTHRAPDAQCTTGGGRSGWPCPPMPSPSWRCSSRRPSTRSCGSIPRPAGERCSSTAIFTNHIVGLDEDESDALLAALYRQIDRPEYQCRFRWTPHAVAFWDNRATLHYAASDYHPARRVMDRISIAGDRPVGPS